MGKGRVKSERQRERTCRGLAQGLTLRRQPPGT